MPPKTVRIYVSGDLVFAKIKGYPPWPARIEEEHPTGYKPTPGRYPVFFFGTYETAVVSAKDLYPYDQYKHQFGIKRKMKNFNEGLLEISETPFMSLKSDELIKIREERENHSQTMIDEGDNDASDASFQKSDVDSSLENSSSESNSFSGDERKKKNGKLQQRKTISNCDSVRDDLSSKSGSESDAAMSTKSNNDSNSEEKITTSKKKSKQNLKRKNSRLSKIITDDISDSDEDDNNSRKKSKIRINDSGSDRSDDQCEDDEKVSADNLDSDITTKKDNNTKRKKNKRIQQIDSSDSDSSSEKNISIIQNKSKNDENSLEDVLKLKQKLKAEKLARKLEQKEKEKERRKQEKLEQKRLQRIKKTSKAIEKSRNSTIDNKSSLSIGSVFTSIDQNIKVSLSINNANVNRCLEAMESINTVKVTSQEISAFGNQLKELIQTLKKCKKYKADQRVREKAELCLIKLKQFFTTTETINDPKCEESHVNVNDSSLNDNNENINIDEPATSSETKPDNVEEGTSTEMQNPREDSDAQSIEDNLIEIVTDNNREFGKNGSPGMQMSENENCN